MWSGSAAPEEDPDLWAPLAGHGRRDFEGPPGRAAAQSGRSVSSVGLTASGNTYPRHERESRQGLDRGAGDQPAEGLRRRYDRVREAGLSLCGGVSGLDVVPDSIWQCVQSLESFGREIGADRHRLGVTASGPSRGWEVLRSLAAYAAAQKGVDDLLTRSATSSATTSTHRRRPWSSAWMRSRHGTGLSRSCRWCRCPRTPQPRLRPRRHDHSARRSRDRHRQGHRLPPPPPPGSGVQEVPDRTRQGSPRRPRRPPHPEQRSRFQTAACVRRSSWGCDEGHGLSVFLRA